MFPRVSGDVERQRSPLFAANGVTPDKKKNQNIPFSPVVMVLQPRTSPNYNTPVRCKDFYSSTNAACRICHDEDSSDALISPCNCTGSLGLMHRKCLEKWLSMSGSDRCEICRFRFHVAYRTRHVGQWLISGGAMGPKCFLGDLICLLVLLPLSAMSIYLCAFGAHSYMNKHEWQATGLAFLCLFLLVAFLLWSGLTFRFHYLRFRDWQRANMIVQVIVHSHTVKSTEKNDINQDRGRLNSPEVLGPQRYTPMPDLDLGYNIDIHTLPIRMNAIGLVETRL